VGSDFLGEETAEGWDVIMVCGFLGFAILASAFIAEWARCRIKKKRTSPQLAHERGGNKRDGRFDVVIIFRHSHDGRNLWQFFFFFF